MTYTTLQIPGGEALATLKSRRRVYPTSMEYPFLIGDSDDLEQLRELTEFSDESFDQIIRNSFELDLEEWMSVRRTMAEEYATDLVELLGEWPGEISEKGSISLHRDVLSKRIKPNVFLGLAAINEPWQLPAVLKYGGWNECPTAEIHCAMHRKWQAEFGAQITGMSGDIVECIVNNPPLDQDTALQLAWEHYWYCADIVEQGCESIQNLAATLINAPYWYFWWD